MFYFTLPEETRRAVAQLPERKVKHYVDVIARMRDDGLVTPLAVCWGDGRTYQVEQCLRPSPVALPPKSKDDPVFVQEYRVRIMSHVTKLYFERDRSLPGVPVQWYVMVSPTKPPWRLGVRPHDPAAAWDGSC